MNNILKVMEVYEKVGSNAKQVHENKAEIYNLSRMLPESEGYKLVTLFDSTVHNICEAYGKVGKS